MNPLNWFRGLPQVAVQELVANLKSIRFIVMALVTALVVVGGAYGFSGLGGGPFQVQPFAVWAHPAFEANGDHVAVVWVSDPFGNPLAGRSTQFETFNATTQRQVVLGTTSTDADGFARFNVNAEPFVAVVVTSGTATVGTGVIFDPPPRENFTAMPFQADLDSDGFDDDFGVHVMDLRGEPAPARILVNGTFVGLVDRFGYLFHELPEGESNMTVEVGAESTTFTAFVFERPLPFASGPDFVLLIMAGLTSLVISIFAIVISFDAISKERVQGTLDLLLSRPVSRSGVLLGKFAGAFAAVALPVTLVNLAGISVIGAVSGRSPDGGFAAAFLGLALLLIAYFVLLQLSGSTLAKTSGTAVLYGVLVWLVLTILYNITTFLLSVVLFPGNPEGQFLFVQASSLGNPIALYGQLVSLAAPESVRSIAQPTAFDATTLGSAAIAWFVLLLALALWTFQRKVAE